MDTDKSPHHEDADLQSFIQSGMGIALPALTMDHTEESFEVGHFGELMRDNAPKDIDDPRGEKRTREEETEETGKRTRQASHHEPSPPRQDEPLPLLTPPIGRPETADERKARQREANRLAAGRSRGKKRDELAILEKTVQNIQDENNRLRIQLEALVSAAHQPLSGSPADLHGDPHLPAASHIDEPSVEVTTTAVPAPGGTDIPLGLGVDGIDLSALDSLRRQLESTRREVTELQSRAAGRATEDGDGATSFAVEKGRTGSLVDEKEALVCLIETLKRERDETELDRSLLERELTARRALLAGSGPEADVDEETEGPASHVEGKKHLGGEPGRDVGVERALMEVRSWLDDALTGWQKTGVLQPPTSVLDGIPNPPADLHGILHALEPTHVVADDDDTHEGYELDTFHAAPGHDGEGERHGLMDGHDDAMLEELEGDEMGFY